MSSTDENNAKQRGMIKNIVTYEKKVVILSIYGRTPFI